MIDTEQIYQDRKDASKHQADWRLEARENYEFVAGAQWDDADRAALEEQQRPCVVFNRVGPIIDSVVGYEVNNRRETRYMPRGMSDSALMETLDAAAQWVRDRCAAEDEENDAFRDMLICGMGWIETHIDESLDDNGRIVMERVPPLEMRWDPAARKSNLEDANWVIREKWMDIDEVRAMWPEQADDIMVGTDDLGDSQWMDQHDATNAWRYAEDQRSAWWDPHEGKVLVVQYQWREKRDVVEVGDPESGRIVEFTPERWERIQDRVNLPFRLRSKWAYYQSITVGPTELEQFELDTPCFSFRAMTGKRDEETGVWYGLVRAMKDPQKWANVFFSTALSALKSNAKGGLIVEQSAVDDLRQLEEKWADPSGIVMVNDGALTTGALKEKGFGGYPPALDNLMQFSINSIRDVTGVNMELLGMVGHEQTGMLEVERKQSALTILAPFFASVKRYRKLQGADLLKLMRVHLTPGQVMRITDRDASIFWQDPGAMDYDVVISDSVNSPNLKNEVWQSLQNILPAALRTGMPIPPDLIRFSPLPDSVSSRWAEFMQQQMNAPDMNAIQQQMEQMQAELGKLQQENMQLKDKREAQAMQIQARQQEAQLEAGIKQQQMALDAKAREMELAYKLKMSDADRAAKLLEIEARYNTEMARIREQAEVQRETSAAQVESQREQSVVSIQLEREKRAQERMEREEERQTEERLSQAGKQAQKVASEFSEYRAEMESKRKVVLDYLKRRGGEVAELARQLEA